MASDVDKDAVGVRIKELRISLGMTQREFAAFVGLDTDQTVSRYENGVTAPGAEVLTQIENKTGTSARYILYGEGENVAAPQVLIDFFKSPAGERLNGEQRRGLIMLLRDRDVDGYRIQAAVDLLFPAKAP